MVKILHRISILINRKMSKAMFLLYIKILKWFIPFSFAPQKCLFMHYKETRDWKNLQQCWRSAQDISIKKKSHYLKCYGRKTYLFENVIWIFEYRTNGPEVNVISLNLHLIKKKNSILNESKEIFVVIVVIKFRDTLHFNLKLFGCLPDLFVQHASLE